MKKLSLLIGVLNVNGEAAVWLGDSLSMAKKTFRPRFTHSSSGVGYRGIFLSGSFLA